MFYPVELQGRLMPWTPQQAALHLLPALPALVITKDSPRLPNKAIVMFGVCKVWFRS